MQVSLLVHVQCKNIHTLPNLVQAHLRAATLCNNPIQVFCMQIRAYPSSEAAASGTSLATLLFSAPPSQPSGRSSRASVASESGLTLQAAEAQVAEALAASAHGAAEAASVCQRIIGAGASDAAGTAAALCLQHEAQLEPGVAQQLRAHALEHASTSMMSQLLAQIKMSSAAARGRTEHPSVLRPLAAAGRSGPGSSALQEQIAACFSDARASEQTAPTLGQPAPALLMCCEHLHVGGAGKCLSCPHCTVVAQHTCTMQFASCLFANHCNRVSNMLQYASIWRLVLELTLHKTSE